MPGFRGPGYAGVPGADLENAPTGDVPFTSPIGLPVTRMRTWYAGGTEPGGTTGGVPGKPTDRAAGNPSVSTVPVNRPDSPYGGNSGDTVPQFGRFRSLRFSQESDNRSGQDFANDKLITSDRHAFMKSGYENSGRDSGNTDPPMDGPARPSLAIINRTINYQQGTDNDQNQDDLTRDYTRNPQGMYIGEQGSGWSRVNGGVPGLWQPYGSYAGITNGPVQGIQSPTPYGSNGDGPRSVWSGPPHGLHSPTLPDYVQTVGRYMAVPQQALPRIDRPDNSKIAGQSYSQTVVPQGQTGTAAQNTRINSGVSWNQRVQGNGWRGRA